LVESSSGDRIEVAAFAKFQQFNATLCKRIEKILILSFNKSNGFILYYGIGQHGEVVVTFIGAIGKRVVGRINFTLFFHI